MFDEETGLEPKVFSASIIDPFLLLVRDDKSIYVARCDDDNDLEEIEREDDKLLATKWLSGCLHRDKTGAFANIAPDKAPKDSSLVYMFLLSTEGALFVSYI